MDIFTQSGFTKFYQTSRKWLRLLTGSSASLWLPWLVLVLGLALTYTLCRDARLQTMQGLEAEFEFWVNKVVFNIETRLNSYVQILRGVVGLFDASDRVSRQDFRRYVAALRLEERYAGFQGIGFAVAIPSAEKDQHIVAVRQEGFPSYTIYPEGNRDLYTAIIYLEPFSGRNLRAFGYDMFAESVRHTAMLRARDQNQASLSGKVKLVQDGDINEHQSGFLIYVPIYRRNLASASLEERRSHLLGWAYSPLRMRDMMQNVMGTIEFDGLRSVLNVAIYDGSHVSPDALMFATDPNTSTNTTSPQFQVVRSIDFGGHQWLVQLGSRPSFDHRLQSEKANLIASAGSVSSVLLALLLGVLTASRARITLALRETAQSNQRLATSETQLRSIYDTSLVGIASCGADLRFLQVNHAFCELLEYAQAELVGLRTLTDVMCADELASKALIEQILERQIESHVIENRYVTQSGRLFPALTAARANYDEAGRLTEITIATLDISERKQAEEALKASLEEKIVLLKEVHHRVKNNLQIISSLLNLQMDRAVLPDLLNPLRDTQNRVRSMALLHETLYRSDNLAQINLPDYIESLCTQLWRASGPVTARVELKYQMDSVFLPLDQAVPCGLIINELVSNALKHAYPVDRKGQIWVIVQIRAARQVLLSVADDGIGLPPDLKVSQTDTLGLQLVTMLTQQLQGIITILREARTEFQISFPIKPS